MVKRVQVDYDFGAAQSQYSLAPLINSANWQRIGDNFSASVHKIHFGNGYDIHYARFWGSVWPLSYNGLNGLTFRLQHYDDGPTNMVNVCPWQTLPPSAGPVTFGVEVTSAIQGLATAGVTKQFCVEGYGHGRIGLLRLEIVYNTPDYDVDIAAQNAQIADLAARVTALEGA